MGYTMKRGNSAISFKTLGSSPVKQVDPQKARQDSINKIDAKMEALEEDRFNEKITQEGYNEKMKALRVREKEVKKALPKK
jgi:hypothetical protein